MVNAMDEPSNQPMYDNGNGPVSSEGQNGQSKGDDLDRMKVQYSIPGVLHFIQHEWARFEMERAQWEVERAELQARIAFLQGERKGLENLKNDLIRRIKMLEYALKQERCKFHKLKYGTDLDLNDLGGDDDDQQVPVDILESTNQPNNNLSWRKGRRLLRQYLQEIGYTDTILDVRSFRVRSLLGMNPMEADTSVDGSPATRPGSAGLIDANKTNAPPAEDQDDSDDEDDKFDIKKETSSAKKENLDAAEEEAFKEFDFLASDGEKPPGGGTGSEEWGIDYQTISQMKEQYKQEAKNKKGKRRVGNTPELDSDYMKNFVQELSKEEFGPMLTEIEGTGESKSGGSGGLILDDADIRLGDLGNLGGMNNISEADVNYEATENDAVARKTWACQYTLKSHYDSVRALSFHPVEPVLITASEDATLKLWNLNKSDPSASNTPPTQAGAKAKFVNDIEAVYTFRGHSAPVLCLCMSPTGDACYSGSLDGTIICWTIPSPNIDPYDVYDPNVLSERLVGHTDAVWSVAVHSSDNRLVSASADGTVRLWEPGNANHNTGGKSGSSGSGSGEGTGPLLKSFKPETDEGVPTSVDFVNTDPGQLLAGYTTSAAFIYDIESGKPVLAFESKQEHPANSRGQINQIVSHPTLPITITAHEDKFIRFFDNNTGKIIDCIIAHMDAVTCLSVDPNGLYLMSGSHDSSIRLWNLENKACMQEITAHRKKWDQAIFAVAFHASRPLLASAGADGVVKVFA